MPRLNHNAKVANRAAAAAAKFVEMHNVDENEDDILQDSETSPGVSVATKKSVKKRPHDAFAVEQTQDFGNEMQKMLDCFGADISKTLTAKRQRLEQYTQNSLRTSNRKVEEIWTMQQNERNKLNEEFHKQASAVFLQWESDLDKAKEQDEKLQALFRQQQKSFQQTRIAQSQRLKAIRQLHDQYVKGAEDLDKCHNNQQGNVHSELKKEMAMLQKKILMDTQQQEMKSVRKSLQTMLF